MNETRERMVETFKELVCRKSFHKLTVQDIAKESGMTRENFYYHFHDKFDLVHWIYEHQIAAKLPSEGEDFEKWIDELLRLTLKDYKYYRNLLKDLNADEIRSDLYPIFERRLKSLVHWSIDDSVWNMRREKEEFATAFFADAFLGFYINYVRDHEDASFEMIKMGFNFLFEQFLPFVRNS